MPTGSKVTDKYANLLTQSVTMSAANTTTIEEVNIGLSLFDKVGLLINRVEYHISTASLIEMTAAGDYINPAFGTDTGAANIDANANSTIDSFTVRRMDCGTAASAEFFKVPFSRDFSTLPGGGILITPRPWALLLGSTGLASAATCVFRFYFTVMKLKPDEYFELLETRHYFGQ